MSLFQAKGALVVISHRSLADPELLIACFNKASTNGSRNAPNSEWNVHLRVCFGRGLAGLFRNSRGRISAHENGPCCCSCLLFISHELIRYESSRGHKIVGLVITQAGRYRCTTSLDWWSKDRSSREPFKFHNVPKLSETYRPQET